MPEKKKDYISAAYGSSEPSGSAGGTASSPPPGAGTENAQGAGEDPQRQAPPAVLPGILGKQLRAAYGELLNTPVPDRINDLIKQLQQREAAAASKSSDEEGSS